MQTIADKDGDAEHEIAPFPHKKSRSHHHPRRTGGRTNSREAKGGCHRIVLSTYRFGK
jgi:hypothetical protein